MANFEYVRSPTGELSGASLVTQTESALTALSDAVISAEQAATAAQTASQTAAEQAQAAAESASTASSAAQTATQDAATALTTAQTASETAGSALSTAQGAVTTAGEAVTAATNAKTAAEHAQSAAEGAASDAHDAAEDAATAAGTAQTALETANAATTTAGQAASNASAAVTTAGQASTTAGNALALAQNAVLLSGAQSVAGIKTFSDSPLVPTPADSDNSQKAANAIFVKNVVLTALEAVWGKMNALDGVLLTFASDTATAYTKSLPSDSFSFAGINSVGGRSLAWNQLYQYPTESVSVTTARAFKTGTSIVVGHKYFVSANFDATTGTSVTVYEGDWNRSFSLENANADILTAATGGISTGGISRDSGNVWVYLYITGGATVTHINIIDLTLMFGSGNEPSTVAEFRQMFPEDYYPYSAGEILSAAVNKIVSKDSNSVEIDAKTIPAAILALPGYGWSAGTAKNWVDWENKAYHQEVSSQSITGAIGDTITLTDAASAAQYICGKGDIGAVSGGVLTLTAAVTDEPVQFELATPIVTDISALIDDNSIQVEPGGSLTFENSNGDDYRIPVPSELRIMKYLPEA